MKFSQALAEFIKLNSINPDSLRYDADYHRYHNRLEELKKILDNPEFETATFLGEVKKDASKDKLPR